MRREDDRAAAPGDLVERLEVERFAVDPERLRGRAALPPHSHSIVPGGLEVTS